MMQNTFTSKVIKTHKRTNARVVRISTPHGEIVTPAFMPVGTKAVVNCLTPEDLSATNTQIILGGNTYHMLCSPGLELIRSIGGMHKFMGWDGPMLTDSGGFQVFSLSRNSDICQIDDEAATFRHPDSGEIIRLTPEASIGAQKIIGADIIMALDQCTPDSDDKNIVLSAMRRTHRWLTQSKTYHEKEPHSAYGYYQALFGIIQGGYFRDLREESASFVVSMDLDGIAIGGESIGYKMDKTIKILNWVIPTLPSEKPRYTMGVGAHPQNLLDVVAAGVDIFDCVAPTRNARHGSLFCGQIVKKNGWVAFESEYAEGRINLNNQRFATDDSPIMDGCGCTACARYSRAYLKYLLKNNATEYYELASIHNVQVMQDTCKAMRDCILEE